MLSATLMINANALHFILPLSYMKCRTPLRMFPIECIQFSAPNGKVFARRSASLHMKLEKNQARIIKKFHKPANATQSTKTWSGFIPVPSAFLAFHLCICITLDMIKCAQQILNAKHYEY